MKITKQNLKSIGILAAGLMSVALLTELGDNIELRKANKELSTQVVKLESRIGRRDPNLPIPQDNQIIIPHPDYLSGAAPLGYTILTDVDRNGTWDVAEKVYAGFTTGSGYHILLCKKGFGPSQSLPNGIECQTVSNYFFQKIDENLFDYKPKEK